MFLGFATGPNGLGRWRPVSNLKGGGKAMTNRRVLSVGQCGYDHWSISRALQRSFGATVVPAATAEEALERLHGEEFALVLVNRVLDADGGSGLELIRRIRSEPAAPPVMLVSNYEDAQIEAVAAGAAPGFGKAAVGLPEMLLRVQPFLEPSSGEAS
jgi:two-component system chemotaxis response regulator CheY